MQRISISYSESQAQLSSTLDLQSSSTLGTGVASTNKERLEKLEDKEVRRAIESRPGKRKRVNDNSTVVYPLCSGESEDDDSDIPISPDGQLNVEMGITESEELLDDSLALHDELAAVGSALRRNEDGSIEAPKIVTKKSTGKKVLIALAVRV
jgi:ATP-dependent RNA helicase DHX37/DHR1